MASDRERPRTAPGFYRLAWYLVGLMEEGEWTPEAQGEPQEHPVGQRVPPPRSRPEEAQEIHAAEGDPEGEYPEEWVEEDEQMLDGPPDDDAGTEADPDAEEAEEVDQLMAAKDVPPRVAADPPGLAVLDSACQMTMHGAGWRVLLEEALAKRGLAPRRRAVRQRFRGIGGTTISDEVVSFPVGIYGCSGQLESAEIAEDVPCLLSRHTQAKLGAQIYLRERRADFTQLGIYGVPLVETRNGRLG